MSPAPTTPALDRLLGFAARAADPAGGFASLDDRGGHTAGAARETLVTARMTHVFGLAAAWGRPGAAELAEHGRAALAGLLHDDTHGGWVTAVPGSDGTGGADDAKQAYVHAFVVLAGATLARLGLPGGAELLTDALAVWDEHFWDEAAGAAVETWDAAWTSLDGYRGANANMHGVEAQLAAADALAALGDPARAAVLRERCLRVTARLVRDGAGARGWRLPEHHDQDWRVLPEHGADTPADPFRPYGVTVGHQLEWSRLALHLAAALGEPAPAWLGEASRALYRVAVARGESPDGHPGFVYTLGWDDRPVVVARMHWVQAEALAAATVLAAVTGEPGYAADHARWSAWVAAVVADPSTGSWHHELTPEGRVGRTTWTGQPDAYHVAQALLLPRIPLAGSVAEGVARVVGPGA